MKVLRLVLFPFTFLYGFAVILRNLLYDAGILRSHQFDLPVIAVGNITVGGAGKSPMTAYLVELLHNRCKIAVLSRGYGRDTRGFYEVNPGSSVSEVGDESLQLKNKFPAITVAVCEDRVAGIQRLKDSYDVIILDDAYQHRAVKPGLNILLIDYTALMKWQWLLPSGDLREPLWSKKRADCMVVTKTAATLGHAERQRIIRHVQPLQGQPIFFSCIRYGDLMPLAGTAARSLQSVSGSTAVVLLTGIANPAPLVDELMRYTRHIYHHCYADHHQFTRKNMIKLVNEFNTLNTEDKIIITTEKDAQRLGSPDITGMLGSLPVYYLPVKAVIHEPEHAAFDTLILNYVTGYTRNN